MSRAPGALFEEAHREIPVPPLDVVMPRMGGGRGLRPPRAEGAGQGI